MSSLTFVRVGRIGKPRVSGGPNGDVGSLRRSFNGRYSPRYRVCLRGPQGSKNMLPLYSEAWWGIPDLPPGGDLLLEIPIRHTAALASHKNLHRVKVPTTFVLTRDRLPIIASYRSTPVAPLRIRHGVSHQWTVHNFRTPSISDRVVLMLGRTSGSAACKHH